MKGFVLCKNEGGQRTKKVIRVTIEGDVAILYFHIYIKYEEVKKIFYMFYNSVYVCLHQRSPKIQTE